MSTALLGKIANFMGFETGEDYEEYEFAEGTNTNSQNNVQMSSNMQTQNKPKQQEKVVKFNDIKSKNNFNNGSGLNGNPNLRFNAHEIEHVLLAPTKFEDAKRIADEIRAKKIVTLNMSNVSYEVGTRILDFISGTAYALEARITKVSDNVFITSPGKVKQINELPSHESDDELFKEREEIVNANANAYGNEEEEIIRKIAK